MISVRAQIEIAGPIEEVFDYVSNPRNFPAWNSAVQSVQPAGPTTYFMERNLPGGRAANKLEVVVRVRLRELVFHTTSGPTPFGYRIRFTPIAQATLMELDVSASLGPVGDRLGPLGRGMVKRGVDANLASLRAILEQIRGSANAAPSVKGCR